MSHSTPEHMVRPESVRAEVRLTCLAPGCGWTGRVGWPAASGLDMDPDMARNLWRSAMQAATVHGWPEIQPIVELEAPEPTARRGFWDRIRGAVL